MATPVTQQPKPPFLVDQGFVDSRDPSLLRAGEVIRADDSYYQPGNPTLWSVPGRVATCPPESGQITGGVYLEFDSQGGNLDRTDYVVIQVIGGPGAAKYRESPVGLSLTFKDAVTNLIGGPFLDSCHYSNRHMVFNGVDRNRVRETTGWRFHGMLDNKTPPSVNLTGGVGTGFTLSNGKSVSYWIEERVKDSQGNILRRNGTPQKNTITILVGTGGGQTPLVTVAQTPLVTTTQPFVATGAIFVTTGAGTLIKPVITRPNPANPTDATHWALYASAAGDVFPTGAQIAEVPIATLSIEDTRIGTDPLLPSGEVYQTTAVILYGISQTFSRNGPPPISTSMDIMEDSAVANNVADKSIIQYSYPDNIDAWPYNDVIRFETKEADEVIWCKFLGTATIVALRDTLWRINTLPEPTDSGFQPGRVKEQIDGAHGGVGAQGVCLFSFGNGNQLAYVSRYGIMTTDGDRWNVLTDDLKWEAHVDISQLSQAILKNNKRLFRLEFTFTPIGGALNSQTWFLHYHPTHTKFVETGGFTGTRHAKLTGPINRDALCKFTPNINGLDYIFSGTADGNVYQEWVGVTNPSAPINYFVLTPDHFPFGVGSQGRPRRFFVHHQATQAGQRAIAHLVMRVEGQDDVEETRSFRVARREHTGVYIDAQGEAFQFGVSATDPPTSLGVDFFKADFEYQGESTADGEP